MPYIKNKRKKKLRSVLKKIKNNIYNNVAELSATAWMTEEPVIYENRRTGEKKEIKTGDKWGELFDCAWFNFTGQVPPSAAEKEVVLLIDLNGEGCVYDENGVPIRGLTSVKSNFSRELGKPGKRVFRFLDKAQGGEEVNIWVDGGNNDLFGNFIGNGELAQASIAVCHSEMRQLYYDFSVLYELMENISDDKARHHSILYALDQVSNFMNQYTEKEAKQAREMLASELEKKGGTPSLEISAIGHAHLDLAWLWPIRETIRKGARTFSTVLSLMDRYPDYKFGASQPQLYQWMKEHYPELYEKIKQKIAEGRWEVQGAMWVESDTNVPHGESLVRQILYGKKFFQDEFDIDVEVLWLPDVFGYSGSLPQILKKSGVDYFMTQKLSWSEHNKFPYHTFQWEGIDGSKVLTHMPPEDTYNSPGTPRAAHKIESNFKEKGLSDRALMLYGIGDGGGGPGAEHLEALEREKNLAGMPPIKQESGIEFFNKIAENKEEYKTWHGELYLEKHQGTFTTQAWNKKYNRQLEIFLRELEYASSLSMVYTEDEYPQQEIEEIWKEMLLYQFHDILPGSSIKRVYEESRARYRDLLSQTKKLMKKKYNQYLTTLDLDQDQEYIAFNSLDHKREEWVKVDNDWAYLEVPALGQQQFSPSSNQENDNHLTAGDNLLESKLLRVKFAGDGSIESVYDKENEKEVLASEKNGNYLAVYEDEGDAWDFPMYYDEKPQEFFKLESRESYLDGPQVVMKQVYSYGDSHLEQKVKLTQGSKRLDFVTNIDWQEQHKMLRTSFPVNIFTREADCGIQFGSIKRPTHRNTSWDMAKYEIPVQRWADLSQDDYGVALLNKCKYGYKIKENVLDLNLLRSPEHPGKNADRGKHEFVYALYPHQGDYRDGKVPREAERLNIPLQVMNLDNIDHNKQSSAKLENKTDIKTSLLKIEDDNIVLESLKKEEKGKGIIIRLYENYGRETFSRIIFNPEGKDIEKIYLTDLLENEKEDIQMADRTLEIEFAPFEIITLKVLFTN